MKYYFLYQLLSLPLNLIHGYNFIIKYSLLTLLLDYFAVLNLKISIILFYFLSSLDLLTRMKNGITQEMISYKISLPISFKKIFFIDLLFLLVEYLIFVFLISCGLSFLFLSWSELYLFVLCNFIVMVLNFAIIYCLLTFCLQDSIILFLSVVVSIPNFVLVEGLLHNNIIYIDYILIYNFLAISIVLYNSDFFTRNRIL